MRPGSSAVNLSWLVPGVDVHPGDGTCTRITVPTVAPSHTPVIGHVEDRVGSPIGL